MRLVAPQTIDPHTIPLLTLPSVAFDNRKALPTCAAISFVLNAQGTVLSIGQSMHLAMRWAAHHRMSTLLENQATRIAGLVMEDTALLDAVEVACIAYFDPLCNGYPRPSTRRSTAKKYAYLTGLPFLDDPARPVRCQPHSLAGEERKVAEGNSFFFLA